MTTKLLCPECRSELKERSKSDGSPVWRCPSCTRIVFSIEEAVQVKVLDVPADHTPPEF